MTNRDLATITLKTLAVWLFASGVAGLASALLTWVPDSAQYGREAAAFQMAASSMFVPVGALLWLVSSHLSLRIFPVDAPFVGSPGRADLYAFACVLVGLFLVTDAASQVVYWIVVWRASRGTGFSHAAADLADGTGVVYWVSARAQMGAVVTKLVIGSLLIAGPQRLSAGLGRLRRELSGTLAEDQLDRSEPGPNGNGV